MKKLVLSTLSLGILALCASQTSAQTVTIDPSTLTLGYMNWQPTAYTVANFPGDGGSGSSAWGTSALQANFSGTTLTILPNVNTYTPGSAYWNNPDGTGANQMDANFYNETTGVYVNTTLTFTFDVIANTLAAPYNSIAFIKDFSPSYSSSTESSIALTSGIETISLTTSVNAGDHIQYGFETYGPDTNPSSPAALESVVITPVTAVPEPATWAWAGSGSLLLLSMFRRRNK
jgi:hypothetical protein